MPTTSILCTGDLHLGRVSSKCLHESDEISPYTVRAAWLRLVDFAVAQQIDLVLISGDVADDASNQYEAMGPFELGVTKLAAHGIPVYMVAGNHDARVLPQITSMLSDGAVHLLGRGGCWEQCEWPAEAETPLLSIVGWSYPSGRIPALPIHELHIQRRAGAPVIAVAHTDYCTSSHEYASCTIDALRHVGEVDLWLLGHIHAPEYLPGSPSILNPGSPQALDPGEPGVHGPWVVRIIDGQIGPIEQIPLSAVTYCAHTVDVSTFTDDADLVAILLPILGTNHPSRVSCRITLTGRTKYSQQLYADAQRLLTEQPLLENHNIYLEQIDTSSLRPALDLSELMARGDVISYLADLLYRFEQGEESEHVADYLHGVHEQIRLVMAAPPFRDDQFLESSPDARALLLTECRRLLDWLLRHEEARA